eukprot:GFYU01011283.1.p1 GENE.GFYU01011283.1~~GFYU01011283.1.p1  ORF type:complete len:299 (-),score=83.88 GFYU01011283.1:250-1146(-)
MTSLKDSSVHLGLPKGPMQKNVFELMKNAGVKITIGGHNNRGYRPTISLDGFEVKLLNPKNIVEMLQVGSRDIGFAGADWVHEKGLELVELLDTKLDPVRLVAAAPYGCKEYLTAKQHPSGRPLRVASEYVNLTKQWIEAKGLNAVFVHAYGATEVFPPEDADIIVCDADKGDNALKLNSLEILETVEESTTRLYASKKCMSNETKKPLIDHLCLLLKSVLDARQRVLVEFNCTKDVMDQLATSLPAMRQPTVSQLHNSEGFAVKIAVQKDDLQTLIPTIKGTGGSDIIVTAINHLVA